MGIAEAVAAKIRTTAGRSRKIRNGGRFPVGLETVFPRFEVGEAGD